MPRCRSGKYQERVAVSCVMMGLDHTKSQQAHLTGLHSGTYLISLLHVRRLRRCGYLVLYLSTIKGRGQFAYGSGVALEVSPSW